MKVTIVRCDARDCDASVQAIPTGADRTAWTHGNARLPGDFCPAHTPNAHAQLSYAVATLRWIGERDDFRRAVLADWTEKHPAPTLAETFPDALPQLRLKEIGFRHARNPWSGACGIDCPFCDAPVYAVSTAMPKIAACPGCGGIYMLIADTDKRPTLVHDPHKPVTFLRWQALLGFRRVLGLPRRRVSE